MPIMLATRTLVAQEGNVLAGLLCSHRQHIPFLLNSRAQPCE